MLFSVWFWIFLRTHGMGLSHVTLLQDCIVRLNIRKNCEADPDNIPGLMTVKSKVTARTPHQTLQIEIT